MTVIEFLDSYISEELAQHDVFLATLTVVGIDPETEMSDLMLMHQIIKDKGLG